MTGKIVITSSSHLPRMCAGVSIKGAMEFDLNRFSAAQLRELLGDRLLTVVVGRVLRPEDVDGFIAGVGTPEIAAPAGPTTQTPAPVTQTAAPATTAGPTAGPAEMVSGVATHPAGSQAAVLPAPGNVVVNPETAGGTVTGPAPMADTVVVRGHHGRGRGHS